MKNILLGPPGTGKTTYLLKIMEEAIANGTDPKRIGFISFTKQAIREARDRVKVKFNLSHESLVNFRTLHSFAFRYLGLSTKSLMNKEHFQDLAEVLGIEITGIDVEEFLDESDLTVVNAHTGDRLLFIDGVARNRQATHKDIWEQHADDELDYYDVERVATGLKLFKQQFAILDYTDILEKFLAQSYENELDLLLVDEAQDLSTLQWQVLEKICATSKNIYIAGDDDQAIFKWAGADVDYFIKLQGSVKVLDYSYRLPKEVHEYSKTLLKSIDNRRDKLFNPANHVGSVSYVSSIEELEFERGSWLILARSAFSLYPLVGFARDASLFYSFKERGVTASITYKVIHAYLKLQAKKYVDRKELALLKEYQLLPNVELAWQENLKLTDLQIEKFTSFEKSGESLLNGPRIEFSTIHRAKGAEADNVILSPDLSYKAFREAQNNPEDEARVFYVGVTRAKQNLYILTPQTRYFYDL